MRVEICFGNFGSQRRRATSKAKASQPVFIPGSPFWALNFSSSSLDSGAENHLTGIDFLYSTPPIPQGHASVITSHPSSCLFASNLRLKLPCSPRSRAAIQWRLVAIRLVRTSFPADLDFPGEDSLDPPLLAAPLGSAAHKGAKKGRNTGTRPATKAIEPANDRNCLAPTTGAFRKFWHSPRSFSTFSGGMVTSVKGPSSLSPASSVAPIHFTLDPAAAFFKLHWESRDLQNEENQGEQLPRFSRRIWKNKDRVVHVDLNSNLWQDGTDDTS